MLETADHIARLSAAPPEGQFLDEPPLPREELGQKIQDAIRLSSVLKARTDSPLGVVRFPSEQVGSTTRTRLFLSAAPVGRVPVLLARPTEQPPSPLPAVLAVGDHNTEPEDVLGQILPGLVERGYVVLVPLFRGYDEVEKEHRATLELLCGGSSFTAIRHYEVLLALEYLEHLRARGEVGSIALLGHSGGAGIANAMAWYQGSRFAAVATDLVATYINVSYDQDEQGQPISGTALVMGDSNQQLHQLAVPIANFGMAPVPVGLWPYSFTKGRDFLYRWLDDRLGVTSR